MKFVLFILFCFLFQIILCNKKSGKTPEGRIVGGERAAPGRAIYQISIQNLYNYGQHFCGGSIINDEWILTAAHCLVNQPVHQLEIKVGTNNLKHGGEIYKVEKKIVHPNYDRPKYSNDIALLKTKGKMKFNSLVNAIALAKTTPTPDTHCYTTGWGVLKPGGKGPDDLQELKVNIYPKKLCKQKMEHVYPGHVCTFTKNGEGVCKGDSGGPMVCGNELVGVLNFGRPCAVGDPDVWADVAYYHQWIHEKMEH